MTTTNYERHPLSAPFPEDARTIVHLTALMRRHGFDEAHPILLFEGMILDGWHRYRAAQEAHVSPVFAEFTGDNRAARVLLEAENSARRHLSGTAIAVGIIVADAQLPQEQRRSDGDIMNLAGIKVGTLNNAKAIARHDPELAESVASGETSVKAADRERRGSAERIPLTHKFSDARSRAIARARNRLGVTFQQLINRAVDEYLERNAEDVAA